jgi:2-polyprenyl-3-methyl-5-hydroxy-6-metoxy-1,4-benzoquinol methylase/glycosyltransferase involved in cell wall biosynthesis
MQTALYICYFGSDQPLVHTQVLPYLRRIAASGVKVHLLTYETGAAAGPAHRAAIEAGGIRWHSLGYHKRPSLLATGYDVLAGILYSVLLVLRHRIDIIHARSHVAGAMGLALKRLLRVKLIFDFRGLMAEEYVDNGVWVENSPGFRLVKRAERALLARADRVVVLTEKLKAMLIGTPSPAVDPAKIFVIPCCIDLSQYSEREPSDSAGFAKRITLAYAGSATGRYMLREMIGFFRVLQDRSGGSAHFLVITKTDRSMVQRAFLECGIDATCYSIVAATPEEVPGLLSSADIGISFIRRSQALAGATPTKIGEYLAAGLPVVSSTGVGDTDAMLAAEEVGITVTEFDAATYERAIDGLLRLIEGEGRARCRAVAARLYSLEDIGGPRYVAMYQSLTDSSRRDPVSGESSWRETFGDATNEPDPVCPACANGSAVYIGTGRDEIRLRRCRSCGLAFHKEFSNSSEIGDFYGHYYREENMAFSSITESRFRSLMDSFQSYRESGRILDVGCGAGHLLKVAMDCGWRAYGTEIAAGAFDQLARLGVDAYHGELQSARYSDGFFDVVYCSEVIEHLLDPVSFLEESARILRPGGLLYLTTPNFNSLSRRLLGLEWRVFGKEHVCYFTPASLSRALRQAGFMAIRARTRNIDPNELKRVLTARVSGNLASSSANGFDSKATEGLRIKLQQRPALRIAKNSVNLFLGITGMGDTICASAVR